MKTLTQGSLRLLMAGLALAVVSGCGGQKDDASGDAATPSAQTEIDLPPATEDMFIPPARVLPGDPEIADLDVDTTYVRLDTAITGQKVFNRQDTWVVNYAYFYMLKEPVIVRTMAQMDSIAAAGGINDTTMVGVATYQLLVTGKTPEEAHQEALIRRPQQVPTALTAAVQPRPRTQTITMTPVQPKEDN